MQFNLQLAASWEMFPCDGCQQPRERPSGPQGGPRCSRLIRHAHDFYSFIQVRKFPPRLGQDMVKLAVRLWPFTRRSESLTMTLTAR